VKHTILSPINKNNKLKEYLKCIDYTVSKKTFFLLQDLESELLITSPQPKSEDLGAYYISDAYISHTDSTKSLFDKVYQVVKNYTIKKKVALISNCTRETKTILDIGCGTGDFLVACKKKHWNVIGVEPNEKAQSLAYEKLNVIAGSNFSIEKDISNINTNNKFDVITMWHVLEHIPNLEEYIGQLKNLLKPNGTLLIAVPNYNSFDAKHYKQFWAAYDVPRHLWHFSKKAISFLFEKENMKVVKILPMKFDSYYVSLLSEKNKTGNSNIIKAFLIGLKSNILARKNMEYSSLIYKIKNN